MFQFWPSVIKPMLDAAGARRVIEIGAGDGNNSRQLARWARDAGARVEIVDPEPGFDMERLATRFPEALGIHRRPSLEVLEDLLPADAVLIDGDHNWYTVYHELRALYGSTGPLPTGAPIAICHDVEWPYGRRDLYYVPERIPHEHRQPARIGGLVPGMPGLSADGLNSGWCHAEQEGGPHNGVRTAIEDALRGREDALAVAWLPVLHGLAVIVPRARLEANEPLRALFDSLDLGRPLRSLLRLVERERLQSAMAERFFPRAVSRTSQSDPGARDFGSSLPEDVLAALLRGCFDLTYKGRAIVLNPLDMANYLALLGSLRPRAVIEVGTHQGGRALWLADNLRALGLEARVITIDFNPPEPLDDPGVEMRAGNARDLGAVLPPEEVAALGHPLLVIEDSAHDEDTCAAVLDYFDPLLSRGDYVVLEDGAFRSQAEARARPDDLSPPSRALSAFLARRGDAYEIDASICDRFGYNATFNPNGWLRRR